MKKIFVETSYTSEGYVVLSIGEQSETMLDGSTRWYKGYSIIGTITVRAKSRLSPNVMKQAIALAREVGASGIEFPIN